MEWVMSTLSTVEPRDSSLVDSLWKTPGGANSYHRLGSQARTAKTILLFFSVDTSRGVNGIHGCVLTFEALPSNSRSSSGHQGMRYEYVFGELSICGTPRTKHCHSATSFNCYGCCKRSCTVAQISI